MKALVGGAAGPGACDAGARIPARRVRVRIRGTVQGVGFRPFVHRVATEGGLAGFVFNDSEGVVAEVEGDPAQIERFLGRIETESPPLASIESIEPEPIMALDERGFAIRASPASEEPRAPVTPDSATCDDCLRELFDPADRRHRYPFINCTNCGPRFTIVRAVPYDRPNTTMAGFTMCAACRAEYDDPADRRFHAQPNACPECGPQVRLVRPGRDPDAGAPRDPIATAAQALRAGLIVAVKGIGGYHLACRADDEEAVAALRARKRREARPFALMVPDVASARTLAALSPAEEELLASPARPIVLTPRLPGAPVAGAVAPHSRELGLMLPYSPLHHLLLDGCGAPLVMTSGNVSDEPIAFGDADALTRLAGIADLFLVHDRPIQTRTDDSVMRVVATADGPRRLPLRRSRGYVPGALRLPLAADRPVLACGAQLKNTFCLARDERAVTGHHVGDLVNWETLSSFADGVAHFERLFAVAPAVVAHDLHPEYLSTKYALERDGVELVGVQHHHAHLAACLAEHGEIGPAVGAIFDGTGYGTDGTIWGGELLFGDLASFLRAGMLWPVRMPGGAMAIRQPWRMAAAWLVAAQGEDPELPPALAESVEGREWRDVCRLARSGIAAPITTSMGRLFDAVAALCGIRPSVSYEGQAAIELEGVAAAGAHGVYPLPLVQTGRSLVLDARAAVSAIAADIDAGEQVPVVSARFHDTIAGATAEALTVLARRKRIRSAVLSGGVFQNRRLLEATAAALVAERIRVLTPEQLPPGDGGISFGQVAVAAARTRERPVEAAATRLRETVVRA